MASVDAERLRGVGLIDEEREVHGKLDDVNALAEEDVYGVWLGAVALPEGGGVIIEGVFDGVAGLEGGGLPVGERGDIDVALVLECVQALRVLGQKEVGGEVLLVVLDVKVCDVAMPVWRIGLRVVEHEGAVPERLLPRLGKIHARHDLLYPAKGTLVHCCVGEDGWAARAVYLSLFIGHKKLPRASLWRCVRLANR